MPCITVNTSKVLTKTDKDAIKTGLGTAVTLIPGKTEPLLMVNISDGHTIYMGGTELKNGAFVDVKCYKNAPFEANKLFTEAVYKLMNETIGVSADQMYLSINELPVWGTKGSLK